MRLKTHLRKKHKQERPKRTEKQLEMCFPAISREIPRGLKLKLDNFFEKQPISDSMSYFKLVDNIKHLNWEYSQHTSSEFANFPDSLKYCFHKHNAKIANNSKVSYDYFRLQLKAFGRRRIVAGVILVNKRKEVLCVVAPDGRITFPMKKKTKKGSHELIAFRELGTGVWLSDGEYRKQVH